jgi:hypothetical protein
MAASNLIALVDPENRGESMVVTFLVLHNAAHRGMQVLKQFVGQTVFAEKSKHLPSIAVVTASSFSNIPKVRQVFRHFPVSTRRAGGRSQ